MLNFTACFVPTSNTPHVVFGDFSKKLLLAGKENNWLQTIEPGRPDRGHLLSVAAGVRQVSVGRHARG